MAYAGLIGGAVPERGAGSAQADPPLGLKHLNIDEARQKAACAACMFPAMKNDHDGSGASMVQQWNASQWVAKNGNR
jgi:hypothetical protein